MTSTDERPASCATAPSPSLGRPRRAAQGAGGAAVAGWVLFDWAAQPFFTLVTTFVYAPYFANAIAPDPVAGQALWGYATAAAGLAIAALSPALGAIADAAGRRKPWIAAFGAALAAASAALWFGRPGEPQTIPLALIAFALAAVAAEFSAVFTNAMMPSLAPARRLGRLSGTGWAVGYLGGLVSLVIVLGFLAASPSTGKTLLGLDPLFGLDPAAREGDRAAGPFTALWFAVFVLPLFLFTPDEPRKAGVRAAVRQGLAALYQTLRRLPRRRDMALFLLANMIYADGLVALFAFGGIYAAGTFGWSTIEIGVFGILLTIAGAIGALIGGRLDDLLGPKRVIAASLVILFVAGAGILSIGRDHIAFVIAAAPPAAGDGLYASAGERAYLALGLMIGLAAGPLQAASRTLLVRLSPADRITQFFGLLALSGRLTSFLGPLMVASVTAAFASQKAGMTVLLAFFAAGLLLLARVEVPEARDLTPAER